MKNTYTAIAVVSIFLISNVSEAKVISKVEIDDIINKVSPGVVMKVISGERKIVVDPYIWNSAPFDNKEYLARAYAIKFKMEHDAASVFDIDGQDSYIGVRCFILDGYTGKPIAEYNMSGLKIK